jgi:hypothetical protein
MEDGCILRHTAFGVMYQDEDDVFLYCQKAMEGLFLVTKRNFTEWEKQISKGSVCYETGSGSDIEQIGIDTTSNYVSLDRRYKIYKFGSVIYC